MKIRTLSIFMIPCLLLSVGVLAQDNERFANEGTIGDKWMLAEGTTLAVAQYPAHMAARGGNVCIALGYTIGTDGKTSSFSVLKQWNSESGEKEPTEGFWQAFAQAGADAVSQWSFKPRPEVHSPVPTRTVATLGFNGQKDVDAVQLRSHCKIGDLAAFVKSAPKRNDVLNQQLEWDRQAQQQRLIEEQLKRANAKPGG